MLGMASYWYKNTQASNVQYDDKCEIENTYYLFIIHEESRRIIFAEYLYIYIHILYIIVFV